MNRNGGRALLAVVMAVFALALASCGDSPRGRVATSAYTSPTAPWNAVANPHAHVIAPEGYVKYDGDGDFDDHHTEPSKEDEQEMVLASRRGADAADRQAVSAVIRAYMQAAAAGDGTKGCMLLARTLAEATAEGAPTGKTKTCPTALSRLFREQHSHLAVEEVGSLVVTGVHVLGDVGFATLGFRKALETELLLRREGAEWKVDALFDSVLP